MDPQERYDRFVSALGFRAGLADTATPGLELTDLDGEPVDPTVHLHVCPRTLADHVGADEAETPAVPEAGDVESDELDDPEAARLQTLLAQIEEAILVREPGHDHLVLVDGGVKAVREGDVAA